MGGVFSGQRDRKKRVVESCNAIDTADLNRWRLLKAGTNRAGSLEWRRGDEKEPSSSVGYTLTVESGRRNAAAAVPDRAEPAERFDYPVRLVTTALPPRRGSVVVHLPAVVRWGRVRAAGAEAVPARQVLRLPALPRPDVPEQPGERQPGLRGLRGGLDFGRFGRIEGMSVPQLGFALKVLTFEQKRLDRLGKRLDRTGRRRPKAMAEPARRVRLTLEGIAP